MRVLVVDSDIRTAESIETMLASEGMNVATTDLGEDAVSIVKHDKDYDIILLELKLSDISGHDVLRRMRAAKVTTPVMVVSGITQLDKKILALHLGADDYLEKPFHKDELVARIHAIDRRTKGFASNIVTIGPLSVDFDKQTATMDGVLIDLTVKEYKILELLVERPGITRTKVNFLNHLYDGEHDEPELKIIDVYISKMRAKIDKYVAKGFSVVETVWGRGYKIHPDLETYICPSKSAADSQAFAPTNDVREIFADSSDSPGPATDDTIYERGNTRIQPGHRKMMVGGKSVPLTAPAFTILSLLLAYPRMQIAAQTLVSMLRMTELGTFTTRETIGYLKELQRKFSAAQADITLPEIARNSVILLPKGEGVMAGLTRVFTLPAQGVLSLQKRTSPDIDFSMISPVTLGSPEQKKLKPDDRTAWVHGNTIILPTLGRLFLKKDDGNYKEIPIKHSTFSAMRAMAENFGALTMTPLLEKKIIDPYGRRYGNTRVPLAAVRHLLSAIGSTLASQSRQGEGYVLYDISAGITVKPTGVSPTHGKFNTHVEGTLMHAQVSTRPSKPVSPAAYNAK